MDPIYVCGHRNPDTDSVVSAMAFAALHNALGDNAYVAAMQGAPNDETQFLLDRFGFQAPTLLTNVRTQVRDIDYDRPPQWKNAGGKVFGSRRQSPQAGRFRGSQDRYSRCRSRAFW